MKKEKIDQKFFFFFLDCEDRGLEFWGLVGSGTCKDTICNSSPRWLEYEPNESKIINL